jgi:histidinol-phosphatase (PHP family)
MLFDYHIHTSRCCHASGAMSEYLEEAVRKGLTEMGFADHFPLGLLNVVPDHPVTMQPPELPDYIRDVAEIRQTSPIPIRLGVEMDYLPGREKETAALLKQYDFDYVIGSIHFMDNWDFTHPGQAARYEEQDVDQIYRQYFTLVQSMAQSGLFPIIGHLDVVKKFSYFPRKNWDALLEETCAVLKKADVTVEMNTSGWRAPVGDAYPGEAFLDRFLDLGIPVTLGSDAHCPRDVGSGLRRAVAMLEKMGFRELAMFEGGERKMRPLVIPA